MTVVIDSKSENTPYDILEKLKTVDGTGSLLDADKLDGQEGSYYLPATTFTNTYTASDVLTKIKTVDGTGSGLDADLLDGRQGSAFAQTETKGTTDLNTIIQSGMYRIEATNANLPVGVGYGQLLVIHGTGDTITQIVTDYQSTVMWWRSGNSPDTGGIGTWAGWKRIYHEAFYGTTASTSATTGTMTVVMDSEIKTITPSGACTFNGSGGYTGRKITFVITTSGTTSRTLTWGTNFKTTATLATGTTSGRTFTVSFICVDGTNWFETGRTTTMV